MTVTRREIQLPENAQHKLAFVLDGVLSEKECQGLIKEAEKKGFRKAAYKNSLQGPTGNGYRSSQRCIIDSKWKADLIWTRIKPFIPKTWEGYAVIGPNERLRILKYHQGDYFKQHLDGVYTTPDESQKSCITIQLYLNEGFLGGNTTFMSERSDEQNVGVVPKTGSILVFQHDILHEGSLLEGGIKYTIRTDIMYDNITKLEEDSKGIPGLNTTPNQTSSSKNKKKKKSSNQTQSQVATNGVSDLTSQLSSASITDKSNSSGCQGQNQQPVATDPAKKLRNLKKKLRDIEALEAKLNSGEVHNPEPEQLNKVAKKSDVMKEIAALEKQIQKS